MCGRGACGYDPSALRRICNVTTFLNAGRFYGPNYNICPQSYIPVLILQNAMLKYYKERLTQTESEEQKEAENTLTEGTNERILCAMRWGLVASWSKDGKMDGLKTINARQESIKEKPMYKRLVNSKRCVVVMNGFYEWDRKVQQRQPYYFTPQYLQNENKNIKEEDKTNDEPLMYMAGLWDVWTDRNNPENKLFTVSIITTSSSKDVSFCHHRMPLMMTAECVESWLNTDKYSIDECFKLIDEQQRFIKIKNHAVPSEFVGNVKNKSIDCIQKLEDFEAKKRTSGIHKYFKLAPVTKKEEKETKQETKKEETKDIKDESTNNTNNTNKMQVQLESDYEGDTEEVEEDEEEEEEDEDFKRAIKASLEEMKVAEADNTNDVDAMDEDEMDEDEMDDELRQAIQASMETFEREETKRSKKRKLDEMEPLEEINELSITPDNPSKKQKLNTGQAKRTDTK